MFPRIMAIPRNGFLIVPVPPLLNVLTDCYEQWVTIRGILNRSAFDDRSHRQTTRSKEQESR